MIIVYEGDANIRALTLDSRRLCHILERAILLVVQQERTNAEADGQVGGAVVVVITRCAADGVKRGIEPGLPSYIFKFAAPQVAVERHAALGTVVGQKKIDLDVIVIIEEAGAGTEPIL